MTEKQKWQWRGLIIFANGMLFIINEMAKYVATKDFSIPMLVIGEILIMFGAHWVITNAKAE